MQHSNRVSRGDGIALLALVVALSGCGLGDTAPFVEGDAASAPGGDAAAGNPANVGRTQGDAAAAEDGATSNALDAGSVGVPPGGQDADGAGPTPDAGTVGPADAGTVQPSDAGSNGTPDGHEVDAGPVGCPTFSLVAFGPPPGKQYAVFDEAVPIEAVFDPPGFDGTAQVAIDPPSMNAFFEPDGHGGGVFRQTDVDIAFRTTDVTFTLKATRAGCTIERQATLRVLGNVWVTEAGSNVVEVFRSDGTYLSQGIGNTWLSSPTSGGAPWTLLDLGKERIAVGMRFKAGVEVFSPDGMHLYSFDTEDPNGDFLWSIYGAVALERHQPDGRIWAGGVREKILVFEDTGQYVETIYLGFQGPTAECLIQLDDMTTVLCTDTQSLPWKLLLLDVKGEIIGPWGNNSNQLSVGIYRGSRTPSGQLVFGGQNTGAGHKGRVVLLAPSGKLLANSPPLDEFTPEYGVVPFGKGYLAAVSQVGEPQQHLVLFGPDLQVVDPQWSEMKGRWRGIMVYGGD